MTEVRFGLGPDLIVRNIYVRYNGGGQVYTVIARTECLQTNAWVSKVGI